MVIVLMGVSGSGKSTLGRALAKAEDWDFLEGDALHPPANIAKMSAGQPLDDTDRAPWLARIADWITTELRSSRHGVVACSALKRRYRDRLREAGPDVRFVYLRVTAAELQRRMRQREHFMPPALLQSQLQTLEPPAADEQALTIDANNPTAQIIQAIQHWLDLPPRPAC